MNVIYFLPIALTLASLTSCTSSRLAVYTDYLSRENLASFIVGTPDPHLDYPMIGQRLIITWTLKKAHLQSQDLHLKIFVRFRNKREVILTHPINHTKGTYVYALLNQDYIDNDGILTYKVELIGNGCLLEEWQHQIWTNLILVGDEDTISQELPEVETSDFLDFDIKSAFEFQPFD